MFEALTQAYEGQFKIYAQLLIKTLNTAKMKKSESVMNHYTHMTIITKELAIAGNHIPEKM